MSGKFRSRRAGLVAALVAASVTSGWALTSGTRPASAATIGLGTQTVGGNLDTDGAGSAEAFQAAAGASGSVASLTVYVDSTSQASSMVVGLYADSAGQPGTLLTQGTIVGPVTGTWNTVGVAAATVTSGSNYWITVLAPLGAGTVAFRDVTGGAVSENSSQSDLTGLPTTWTAGAKWDNSPISAYASLATGLPFLSVSPTALSFGATVGAGNPPSSPVGVSNTGGGSLSFTAASDATWLSVTPQSGSAPQTLTVSTAIGGLSTGTYTGHVTVTATGAGGSPQVIPVTLAVNQPTVPGTGDWPTIEHDVGRSGTATDETQLTTANVGSLTPSWSTTLDGKVTAQPLYLSGVQVASATHDVVIAATNQNTVYAVDANSGAILWSDHLVAAPSSCGIPGGFGITGTPVVDRASGRIYAVTDDGSLRTLSLATGAQAAAAVPLVANPATNYVWGGLTLTNGNLYFPSASNGCDQTPWQGGIYQVAVTGATPQLVNNWITVPNLPSNIAGGGIWGYGGVSVDMSTGHVYAASADDGTGLNGNEGYTPYAGSLLALGGNLNLLGWYQPPQPTNYYCGSAPPCDQDFAATPLIFRPAGCPAMLAAGNKNGQLYVASEATLETDGGNDGSHIQALPLNITVDDLGLGGLSGTPMFDPATNMLYVVDTGPGLTGIAGGLVALSVQADCSLKVVRSHPVGTSTSNSPNSTPTLANGVIYVGVNDGTVAAFDATTGTPLWTSASSGFAVYAAPIVANGRVIAGTWSGAASADAGTIRSWLPNSTAALKVSPTSVSFTATAGGSNPAAQTVSLTNRGSGSLTYAAASNASWLGVNPTGGSVPATLTLQPSIAGLSPATYTTSVTVTPSAGSPQQIGVTLVVNPSPTVPAAPSGVVASPGNHAAVLTWSTPSNGGSPITSYTVTPYVGTTAQPASVVTGNPPPPTAKIGGLTNGTAYTFTVFATNGIGAGPPSSTSAPVTPSAVAAPAVDARVSINGTGTTATSPALSTAQSGDTVVAFVGADGPTAGAQSVIVSGAGLTWTLAGRANTARGTAEVWWAKATSKLTGVTVSSRETRAGYHQMLVVVAFSGSTGAGAVRTASATSGAPSVTLTTTKAASVVYAVGNDWDHATARTAGAGQVITNQWVDAATGDTYWAQDLASPSGPAGTSATVNDTAPTTDEWNMTGVEITGT